MVEDLDIRRALGEGKARGFGEVPGRHGSHPAVAGVLVRILALVQYVYIASSCCLGDIVQNMLQL